MLIVPLLSVPLLRGLRGPNAVLSVLPRVGHLPVLAVTLVSRYQLIVTVPFESG
jgi:hypothetical protein